MKAILIDDEIHCLGTLEILLKKYCREVDIIGKATNGKEGKELIMRLSPDLVFLDVEMPILNGFEMLSQFDQIDFKIIFTTAYDNYAIKAFKVSAVDYLLKPVDKSELLASVSKVSEIFNKQNANTKEFYKSQMDILLENIKKRSHLNPNLALPTLSGLEMVNIESILYLESNGNYTRIIKSNKETITVSKTLKYLEEQIRDYNFVRIHHSHIVNISKIKRYVQGDGGYVILESGQHLNVSRRRKNLLLESLKLV